MPHLLHERLAERIQPGLRRAVRGTADEGVLPGEAADVDDPAATSRAHLRDCRTAAVEDAGEVRLEHAVPVVVAHLGDVRKRADAGVVHEDVHAAEPAHRRADQAIHIAARAHVRAHRLEPVARVAQACSRAESRCSWLKPLIATLAPSSSSAAVMARPIPRDPPVTTATFEFRCEVMGVVSRG